MELTRYEVRGCKYYHSGFVCGGAVIDTLKYIVEIPVTDSNIIYRDQYQAIVYWEG